MEKILNLKDYRDKQGIYAIKCISNNKIYIGSVHPTDRGNSLARRLRDHKYRLNRNEHGNQLLQRAWNKYGEESFEFYVIETLENVEIILEREQYWIDFYESYNKDKGFNLCPTAGSTYNFKWTEEQKLNYTKENHPMYGKKHTEESKQKMSESLKGLMTGENHPSYGKVKSPETIEKWKKSVEGKFVGESNPFYGKSHTEGTKKKISESKVGKCGGENHPMYGKQHSEEAKEKMSKAKLGKEQNPEHVIARTEILRNTKRANTKYKGVSYDNARKKYIARLSIPGNGYIAIGRFESKEEDAHNYDFYALKINGTNCFLNFPDYDYSDFVPKRIIEL
jgi:group I intron endonuclease